MTLARLQRHAAFIKLILSKNKLQEGKKLIINATLNQCQTLAEIVFNVLHKTLKLTNLQLIKLKRWKKLYRKLTSQAISAHIRATYVKQYCVPILRLMYAVRDQILKQLSSVN